MIRPHVTRRHGETGIALMSAVILLAVLGISASAALRYFHVHVEEYRSVRHEVLARGLAESGLEKAVATLRVNPAYAGEENTPLDEGRFTVLVTPGTGAGIYFLLSTATWGESASHPRPVTMAAWLSLDANGQVLNYGLVEEDQ